MVPWLKRSFFHNLMNLPGWHTNRKLIVFESDDWGSIRMPSKEVFLSLLAAGIPVDKDGYTRYDALESSDDLEALFNVMSRYNDRQGNRPIFTANCVTANPDFEAIKRSCFQHYYFETSKVSYQRYNRKKDTWMVWQQGIRDRFLFPQFHGREHLNVSLWMHALQNKQEDFVKAFELNVFGINSNTVSGNRSNYMAAFDWFDFAPAEVHCRILEEGLSIFRDLFGFSSTTMIAPCYIWSDYIERAAKHFGINGFQGTSYQKVPHGNGLYRRQFRYTGQRNPHGQYYLVRNAFFEPTLNSQQDVVGSCLKRINTAFRWKKPAIIGTHRLNYIGVLDESNREQNLKKLTNLLDSILRRWPDVEFVTSPELLEIMTGESLSVTTHTGIPINKS